MAPAKAQRISSYKHCLAMDALLQTALPGGINLFLPEPGDDQRSMLDLWTWVNCEDFGPASWSARSFLQFHLGLRPLPGRSVQGGHRASDRRADGRTHRSTDGRVFYRRTDRPTSPQWLGAQVKDGVCRLPRAHQAVSRGLGRYASQSRGVTSR